jgi:oxygen-independent coproporphyrinogen-3 oxidase
MATNNFISEKRIIAASDLIFEFMLNALRLSEPIAKNLFTERTSLSWSTIDPTITAAERCGFLTTTREAISLTPHGRNFLNDVVEMFLPNR